MMMKPIRAHLAGCGHALSIPVDLCPCGGRDFPDHTAAAAVESPREEIGLSAARFELDKILPDFTRHPIKEGEYIASGPALRLYHAAVAARKAIDAAIETPLSASSRVSPQDIATSLLRDHDALCFRCAGHGLSVLPVDGKRAACPACIKFRDAITDALRAAACAQPSASPRVSQEERSD